MFRKLQLSLKGATKFMRAATKQRYLERIRRGPASEISPFLLEGEEDLLAWEVRSDFASGGNSMAALFLQDKTSTV